MAIEKVSVTVNKHDLLWARAEAKRQRTSLSAVFADALSQSRARRAQASYLEEAGAVDPAQLRQALGELESL